jgi:pilus assembly protein CpaB
MDVRKVMLLVGALLIAAVTALFARSMFAADAAPIAAAAAAPLEASGPQVLVAKRALSAGTILSADMITFQPWPKGMVESAYFLKDATDLAKLPGQVVRVEIAAGQPVTQGTLVAPNERGFLAASLGVGMRAVSISVTENTAVGGFVFPGDRVDLMLTQEVTGEGQSLRVTETIARNVRVLAVDQTVDSTKKEPKVVRTVTMEVTPKLAEKIAVSQTVGSLALSLRSLADTSYSLDRAIAEGEVEVGADQTEKADRVLEQALARMPNDKLSSFTTGAEVSRFQPSNAPPQKADTAPTGAAAATGPGSRNAKPAPPPIRVARGTETTEVPIPTGGS